MDSFFGIGAPELIVILLLAGIVMGPQRIRQIALWLGRTTAMLQAVSRGFMRQLNAELDSVDQGGDIKGAMQEVQELRRQVTSLRKELTSSAARSIQEGKEVVADTRGIVEHSIKPPELRLPNQQTVDVPDGNETGDSQAGSVPPSALPNLVNVPDDLE